VKVVLKNIVWLFLSVMNCNVKVVLNNVWLFKSVMMMMMMMIIIIIISAYGIGWV
jgi:hypothetical protein